MAYLGITRCLCLYHDKTHMNQPTLNHNLDNVQMTVLMTEFIDMFMLYLMFLLYYAIADASKECSASPSLT